MAIEKATERLTFADWLQMPETKQRYEIIDGVIRMPPAPTPDHQWTLFSFARKVANHVDQHQLGVVLPAPVDVLIEREPLRTRQPDFLFLSAEHTGVRSRRELRNLRFIELAPDLVVEVLSPSNTPDDLDEKIQDYQRLGVRECWIVSPEAETVEVLRLSTEASERAGLFGRGDTLHSEVLPELVLSVDAAFS